MKRVSVLDLTEEERAKFACILKDYIPQLGIESEPISGADCVDELCELFDALGPVTCEYPRSVVGPNPGDPNDRHSVAYWDRMRRTLESLEGEESEEG